MLPYRVKRKTPVRQKRESGYYNGSDTKDVSEMAGTGPRTEECILLHTDWVGRQDTAHTSMVVFIGASPDDKGGIQDLKAEALDWRIWASRSCSVNGPLP